MCNSTGCDQVSLFLKHFDDIRIGIFDLLAHEVCHFVCKTSIFIEWTRDVQVILEQSIAFTGLEILLTECRCLVYYTCS